MTSPLVARMLANINSCADEERRAVQVAELACYWARTGDFEQAEKLRMDLRRAFGDGRSAPVSILVMCLESLLLYFKELSPKARDWMLRANLLSKTFQEHRLNALTSAWMAHIDFNENRYEAMAANLLTCARHLASDDGGAEGRASLVLGDAFLFAGDTSSSKLWYANAQRCATKFGDHAGIGAMTYNRAALRVSTARFRNLRHAVDKGEASLINSEVNSAINYQAAAELKSLDHLLGAAKAGALMLQQNFDEAKIEIERQLNSASLSPESSQERLLRVDLAYINARSGITDGLEAVVKRAQEDASQLEADDRALLLSSAGAIAGMLGDHKRQADLTRAAVEAMDLHEAAMTALLQKISVFRDGIFRT